VLIVFFMFEISFYIERWSAWAPGLTIIDDWQEWAQGKRDIDLDGVPQMAFVPALQRRRLSRLTKQALTVARACDTAQEPLISVFGSRHGELQRTKKLLDDILQQQPLSPTAFSMSVHNTASGLYSILSGNQQPTTSIAAGEATLEHCFIEAFAWLNAEKCNKVLVVYADEPVPEDYKSFIQYPEHPVAAAFLVTLNKKHSEAQLKLSANCRSVDVIDSLNPPLAMPVLSFLKFLILKSDRYVHMAENYHWDWRYVA
jgi:hypothetical protein